MHYSINYLIYLINYTNINNRLVQQVYGKQNKATPEKVYFAHYVCACFVFCVIMCVRVCYFAH